MLYIQRVFLVLILLPYHNVKISNFVTKKFPDLLLLSVPNTISGQENSNIENLGKPQITYSYHDSIKYCHFADFF